jgi:hypothetical protein
MKIWTPEKISELRLYYSYTDTHKLAEIFGVDIKTVYRKAHKLGIHKSESFKEESRYLQGIRVKQNRNVIKTQFKPGHKTWNKGRKGWQAGGRSLETQFTTGMVPPNTRPVGTYRIITGKRGARHLEQKISNTPGHHIKRWAPVSRIVWESVYGMVPSGHIVVFKPGMRTLNVDEITIERLELITRAENAARNHPRNRDPELGKLYQLKGAITRQVNRLKKESEQRHE